MTTIEGLRWLRCRTKRWLWVLPTAEAGDTVVTHNKDRRALSPFTQTFLLSNCLKVFSGFSMDPRTGQGRELGDGAEGRRILKIKLEEEQFASKVLLLLLQLNYLFEGQLKKKSVDCLFFLSKIAFRYSNRAKLIIITFNIIDFHLDEFQ